MTFKPLKYKPVENPLMLNNLPPGLVSSGVQGQEVVGRLKGSMPVERIEEVMIRRLQLNDKKIATERQLRIKPLHRVAYY